MKSPSVGVYWNILFQIIIGRDNCARLSFISVSKKLGQPLFRNSFILIVEDYLISIESGSLTT